MANRADIVIITISAIDFAYYAIAFQNLTSDVISHIKIKGGDNITHVRKVSNICHKSQCRYRYCYEGKSSWCSKKSCIVFWKWLKNVEKSLKLKYVDKYFIMRSKYPYTVYLSYVRAKNENILQCSEKEQ